MREWLHDWLSIVNAPARSLNEYKKGQKNFPESICRQKLTLYKAESFQ
jgi:hypothetical protein